LVIEIPALLLALDHFGRDVLPGDRLEILRELRVADRHHVRHKWVEEPPLFLVSTRCLVMTRELTELLARLDAKFDAAIPQHLAGLAVVNLGIDVERGK